MDLTPKTEPDKGAGDTVGKHPRLKLYAILSLTSAVPYLGTLWNGFVYDDHYQVLGNPYLQSFRFVKQILTTSVWSFQNAKAITNFYRPMMSLQYQVIYQAYGPLAYAFHLANVLLHVAVVLLLFSVTRKLWKSDSIAFSASALFALHPVHTEVVAWVAALPDLQVTLFLLATTWFYLDIGIVLKRKWWPPIASCLCFALALLSKEPAVMFPAVATAYEHFFRPDRATTTWGQKLWRYSPLWLLTGLYLYGRIQFMGQLVPSPLRAQLSWFSTLLSGVSLLGQYMNKLVWPATLSIFHPFAPSTSPFDFDVLVGAAWILGLVVIFSILWKKGRGVAFGVVWMLVLLSPALNARWMPISALAERYLYLPSIGFCWLAAWGLVTLWDAGLEKRRVWKRYALGLTGLVMVVMCVYRITTRDAEWKDDLTLYRVAVRQNPANATLHANLGYAYWETRKEEAALQEWNLALQLDPNDIIALDNLAMVAIQQERYADAATILRRALSLRPAFTSAHLKLARALEGLGMRAEAEAEYHTAKEISPLDWTVRNQAAAFYLKAGRVDEALSEYQASLDAIFNVEALDGLGDIQVQRGQVDLAERSFRQAIDLNSYDHHAHYQLVCIYGRSGRSSEALREYELAQRTDPGADALGQAAKQIIEEIRRHQKQ
jgi:Flp pilus assembly protein TadD